MTFGQFLKIDGENDWSFESSEISTIWRFSQNKNASSHIFETFGGIKNSSIFESKNIFLSIVCKLEFGAILTFWRFLQEENANSHIFETFGGIKISSISEYENASLSIVCKLEFGAISTFWRFSQE